MLRRWSRLLKKAGESPWSLGILKACPELASTCSAPGHGEVPRSLLSKSNQSVLLQMKQNSVFTHQVITFSNTPAGKIEISPQRKALKHLLKHFLRVKYHMLWLAITCHKASPWPWLLPASATWLMESAPGADRLLRFLTPHVCLLACSVTVTSLRLCYFWLPTASLPS